MLDQIGRLIQDGSVGFMDCASYSNIGLKEITVPAILLTNAAQQKQTNVPDCGKRAIRPADEAEQDEFAAHMAELTQSERSEAPRIPDLWDAKISMLSSSPFKMKLRNFVAEQLEQEH